MKSKAAVRRIVEELKVLYPNARCSLDKAFLVSQRKGKGLSGRRKRAFLMVFCTIKFVYYKSFCVRDDIGSYIRTVYHMVSHTPKR